MGEMADYDMYENINNVGKLETINYRCGYCGLSFGEDENAGRNHVNLCLERIIK